MALPADPSRNCRLSFYRIPRAPVDFFESAATLRTSRGPAPYKLEGAGLGTGRLFRTPVIIFPLFGCMPSCFNAPCLQVLVGALSCTLEGKHAATPRQVGDFWKRTSQRVYFSLLWHFQVASHWGWKGSTPSAQKSLRFLAPCDACLRQGFVEGARPKNRIP